MQELDLSAYESLRAGATVLEADKHGDKVLRLPDGNFVKLFRRKRLISSAALYPYAQRFADNARAHATRRTYGLVKLIVGRDGGLLGAGIVGDRAGELITTLALAMSQRLKVGQLDRLLAPHPTLSETFVALARDYSRSGGVGLVERRLLSLRRYLP